MKLPFSLLLLIMILFTPFSGKAFCFLAAGKMYQIDPLLLIAIAEVESSMNPKAIGLNKKNGVVKTEDIGLMQINSSWLPQLSHSFGITRKTLLNNACQNLYVGAYILAKNLSRHGVNWTSVGAYNAGFKQGNEKNRLKYAKKVYRKYRDLLSGNREVIIERASRGECI
ncbi:lytic transglycosylase (plasmid) [Candidatus Fukatsuia symbiotica]|uniref:Lytic transglycosylase n=2 Tax=Candidatus Fukatsuia symbiotica TaxID=1878942 RepID=A0A2U8I911_9GAMM|nr:lytic transglycosylase [Candidatus Fukatsuia symbiotica]